MTHMDNVKSVKKEFTSANIVNRKILNGKCVNENLVLTKSNKTRVTRRMNIR